MRKLLYLSFVFAAVFGCEKSTELQVRISDEEKSSLTDKYFSDIQGFIDNEFDPSDQQSVQMVQYKVVEPCSKLTTLLANEKLANSFLQGKETEEYDFRASFCLSAAINQVESQPQFTDPEIDAQEICESEDFFTQVCERFNVIGES